jgi:hypothetical protein
MICSSLRTVVYAPSRSMASATWRTVLGPRDQGTWRIASSALVGFFAPAFTGAWYTTVFVAVNTNGVVGRGRGFMIVSKDTGLP